MLSGVDLGDSVRVNLGTDNDLALFHTGGNGVIHNTTGELRIRANNLKLQDYTNEDLMIVATSDGSVDLYHNNQKKFETSATGASVTGNLAVSGNLTVSGTTTELDTTNLNVTDKNITLNYHASSDTSSNADGAGITIQDAVNSSTDATLNWSASNDRFVMSHGLQVTSGVVQVAQWLTHNSTNAAQAFGPTGAFGSSSAIGRAGGTNYHIGGSAVGDMCIAAESSKRMLFGTSASGNPSLRMLIDSSGNVGIGTTAPGSYFGGSNNLVVKQASGEGGITVVTADNTTGYLLFADGTSGNAAYRGQVAYSHSSDVLNLVSSGTMGFKTDTSRVTKATINTTGHLTFNPVSAFSGLNNSLLGSSNGYMYAMGGTAGLYLGDNSALANAIGIRDANYIDFTTSGQNTLKFDLDGIHFQRADGQSITAKESIIMEIDEDNNSASRVFQVRDGSGSVLLNVHDDYRTEVGTLQYGTTTGAGSTQSNGLGAAANDWVDIASIPYGRNVGTIFFWWDGVYSPSSSHHGMMEFELASHYGTSYFYGWDTQLTLTRSTAHNSFYIKEARIITPGGSGATGYFQVKFGAATGTQGTLRVGMKSREESCSITPMTPAVNNSRSGTTLAFLEMQADEWSGKTGRVGHAFSKDVSMKGSLRVDGQPGCSIRGTGAWLSLTGASWNNFIQTPHVIYNSGSWNNTNKRFTAPCSGRYLVTQSVYGRWNGSKTLGAGYLHVGFFINGTSSASNFGGSFPYLIHGYSDTGSTPYYNGPAQTYIVNLSMGDYITPACYAHGNSNESYEQYRYFHVQLLS